MEFFFNIELLASSVRLSVPLLLACLAGLFSERAGVFDIGLEGKMLAAAMAGASAAFLLGSAWLGLAVGILASVFFALIHGLASITFRGNQLISGIAINFIASGLTVLVAQSLFGLGGRTPLLANEARFLSIELPFANGDSQWWLIRLYSDLIGSHNIIVYLAFATVILTWFVLFRTKFGLKLRAVGENPAAVDTAGLSVVRLRFTAVVMAGLLCGIAGVYLSVGLAAGFAKEMTAGRGFIALAALIFAKWRPWPALYACLLFGYLQAFSIRYQNLELLGFEIPNPLMQAAPYILTIIILAGFVGKAIPPKAGGQPYVKER